PQRNEDLAKIEVTVQAIIFILAVVSNSLVLVILLCVRRKRLNRVYLMMVHLTCADLFVAFFNVLPQLTEDILGHFFGGNVLCKMVKYFQVVAMYASSYVLVSTAIDRYMAICHPLTAKTWSKSKMHVVVAIAWSFSLLFSLPQLFIFSYAEYPAGTPTCYAAFEPMWTLNLYITSITIAIYIIPAALLAVAYGRICYCVWKSIRVRDVVSRQQCPASKSTTVKSSSKSKVKTVKLTLTVIVCYLLCWAPFFVTQMWSVWDADFPQEKPEMVIIMLLASLNSCTNPWIYLFF
ncbi:hypothetical protein CAPTEDRAFT_44722, partial [Capitella teleta]